MVCSGALSLRAPAKINLYLEITGQRADGYHTIRTVMQKISLYDRVELALGAGEGIALTCPGSSLPADSSNLVHKAAWHFHQALRAREIPLCRVTVSLGKQIPVAAGLGGGSSDAAAVLLGLNRLYQYPLSSRELFDIGLALGADIPFFLQPAAISLGRGIGEILSSVVSGPVLNLVLVNPGFSVSTKWAYENFVLTESAKEISLARSRAMEWWRLCEQGTKQSFPLDCLYNDLEQVTAARYGAIQEIKQALRNCGACSTLMSGSGPTVFGVFAEAKQAAESVQQLEKQNYFICQAQTLGEQVWPFSR